MSNDKELDTGSIVRKLDRLKLVNGIKPFQIKTHYEVIMGSFAYGVSSDMSDIDVCGIYSPPLVQVFPHINGHINGFGEKVQMDNSYQRHGIRVDDREYDISLASITSFFKLAMECNPNIIDILFVPSRCIVHMDEVGRVIRDNRRGFLHKGIHHKLMGYAYSQLNKMNNKVPEPDSKRYASYVKHGYDVKFAYHLVRLVLQAEMVMTDMDLDLEKNREVLKGIRRGEWGLSEVNAWFKQKQTALERLYIDSELKYTADKTWVKELLFQCLEISYGSLSEYFNLDGSNRVAFDKLNKIKAIIDGD